MLPLMGSTCSSNVGVSVAGCCRLESARPRLCWGCGSGCEGSRVLMGCRLQAQKQSSIVVTCSFSSPPLWVNMRALISSMMWRILK